MNENDERKTEEHRRGRMKVARGEGKEEQERRRQKTGKKLVTSVRAA